MKLLHIGALHGEPLFALEFRYNPNTVAIVKLIPGMRWDAERRMWVGRADAVEAALEALGGKVAASAEAQAAFAPPKPGGIHFERLRDYQKRGAHFLASTPGGKLLADDMRLGKTAQAISALRHLNAPAVIVCPNFVRGVWVEELDKWWLKDSPHGVFLPIGLKPKAIPFGVALVVVHWDILHAWAPALSFWLDESGALATPNSVESMPPRVVIFDEAHALTNPTSQRSKAALKLSAVATHRWALTGTPLTNRPKDLWNVVNTISPGRFGDKFFTYGMRHCGAEQHTIKFNAGGAQTTKDVWDFNGATRLDELSARLKHFMLRRTKYDVSAELPPRTRQGVWVDVPKPKRGVRYLPVEESNTALRAALDGSADAKMPSVAAIVTDHLEQGRKVVCFTWRRHIAEGMADEARSGGFTAVALHGGVSALNRQKALAGLSTDAEGPLLVAATIAAMGVGIDLSWADVIVFAELSWVPGELLQAEARGFKLDSRKPLFIQYVLAKGTADELVHRAVLSKFDTQEAVVGATGEALRKDTEQSEADVMRDIYKELGL